MDIHIHPELPPDTDFDLPALWRTGPLGSDEAFRAMWLDEDEDPNGVFVRAWTEEEAVAAMSEVIGVPLRPVHHYTSE